MPPGCVNEEYRPGWSSISSDTPIPGPRSATLLLPSKRCFRHPASSIRGGEARESMRNFRRLRSYTKISRVLLASLRRAWILAGRGRRGGENAAGAESGFAESLSGEAWSRDAWSPILEAAWLGGHGGRSYRMVGTAPRFRSGMGCGLSRRSGDPIHVKRSGYRRLSRSGAEASRSMIAWASSGDLIWWSFACAQSGRWPNRLLSKPERRA